MNVTGGMFKDEKKWGNHRKQFAFVVGSSTCFQSFGVHSNMNAKSAIEKLQQMAKEKEAQKNDHKRKQKEEVELLRRIEVQKELKRVERGVLYIQSLVIRSLLHSSSSKCAKGKGYNEKI